MQGQRAGKQRDHEVSSNNSSASMIAGGGGGGIDIR